VTASETADWQDFLRRRDGASDRTLFRSGSPRSDWIPNVTLSVSRLRMKIDVGLGCAL
jgi:hypothetical protein